MDDLKTVQALVPRELDALLDFIYENGTISEGVASRAQALCEAYHRALIAQMQPDATEALRTAVEFANIINATRKAAQMQRDAVQPVAWVRWCSDGTYEGPLMDAQMEEVRKRSGAWTPLRAAPHPEAQALDSPRSVTAQEDRVLRNAALRSSTLVASGKLVDSQQQDDHAGSPAPSPVAYIGAGDLEALKYGGHPIAGAKTADDDIALYTEQIRPQPSPDLSGYVEHGLDTPACDIAPNCPCFNKQGAQLTPCFMGVADKQASAQPTRRELDMAMLIRMLCSHTAGPKTKERAMEFLTKHGLQGSPLRAANQHTPTTTELMAAEYEQWIRFHDAGNGDFTDFLRLVFAANNTAQAHGITPQAGKESDREYRDAIGNAITESLMELAGMDKSIEEIRDKFGLRKQPGIEPQPLGGWPPGVDDEAKGKE